MTCTHLRRTKSILQTAAILCLFITLEGGSDGKSLRERCEEDKERKCSIELCMQLKGDVDEMCEEAEAGGMACKGGQSLEELQKNRDKLARCLVARTRIMEECYGGGDPGHWGAAAGLTNAIKKCDELIEGEKNRSPRPPPVVIPPSKPVLPVIPPPGTPKPPGGVEISPDPQSVGKGGKDMKDNVIKSRPSGDSLTW